AGDEQRYCNCQTEQRRQYGESIHRVPGGAFFYPLSKAGPFRFDIVYIDSRPHKEIRPRNSLDVAEFWLYPLSRLFEVIFNEPASLFGGFNERINEQVAFAVFEVDEVLPVLCFVYRNIDPDPAQAVSEKISRTIIQEPDRVRFGYDRLRFVFTCIEVL